MDADLTTAEVNDELTRKGLDPGEVRAFAWELVSDDLRSPLDWSFAPRLQDLKVRLWRIVESLMAAGASGDDIALACNVLVQDVKRRDAEPAIQQSQA